MGTQENGLNGTESGRDGATQLFKLHSPAIYRYCLGRLRSPEEAEDALQATYLNAWRSLKTGFEPHHPRPWLFQIAANVCTSTLRSKLGGPRVELRDPDALEGLVQAEQPEREALLDLTAAVRDLPDRQRRALVLRDWHGLAYDEIAVKMAVSDAAVETLLFRARNKVAATLASRELKPKLATSARALLVWPFGFVQAKSAVASGATHLKMGLVIACGTVAPLVAFGVLQVIAFGPEATGEANKAAVDAPVQPESVALGFTERRIPPEVDGHKAGKRMNARAGAGPRAAGSRNDQDDANVGTPTPASQPAPGPAPAPAQDEMVTLCHQTPAEVRPGVTIQVAPQAAQNGLSQDPVGACG
jgi:RNA polymerase sigma-70 factor (ECF subfamily)